jgi:hypothetical protein
MTAPVASGWSVRRVGLAPTGKRRLLTAHAKSGRSQRRWDRVKSTQAAEALLTRILESSADDLVAWLSSRGRIGAILDWQSGNHTPEFMPISHHPDQVVAITRGYGDASKPEDFLESFVAYAAQQGFRRRA